MTSNRHTSLRTRIDRGDMYISTYQDAMCDFLRKEFPNEYTIWESHVNGKFDKGEIKHSTYKNYIKYANMWFYWCYKKGIDQPYQVDTNIIESYIVGIKTDGSEKPGAGQFALIVAVLKRMLSLAEELGEFDDYDEVNWLRIKRKEKIVPKKIKTLGVFHPDGVLAMRQTIGANAAGVAAFEIMVSTGMRGFEVLQLRPCDFNWNQRPIDVELGQASPYFFGKVIVSPERHSVKTAKPRACFLSKIARRVLLGYMEKLGISHDSDVPLFPYDAEAIGSFITSMYNKSVSPETFRMKNEFAIEASKFGEISSDVGNVPEWHRKQIESNNRTKRAINRKKDINNQKSKTTYAFSYSKGIGNHSLRRMAVCVFYHRLPTGERSNIDMVCDYMSHTNDKTTRLYLKNMKLIESDTVWRQLFQGRSSDWPMMTYEKLGRKR